MPELLTVDDIAYIRQRFDVAYIDRVGGAVASAIAAREVIEVAYQPGNGTHYGLVFVPLHLDMIAAATRGAYPPGAERAVQGIDYAVPGGVLICWVEHGCYPARLDAPHALAYPYVREKLGAVSADAIALADLFDAIGIAARALQSPAIR